MLVINCPAISFSFLGRGGNHRCWDNRRKRSGRAASVGVGGACAGWCGCFRTVRATGRCAVGTHPFSQKCPAPVWHPSELLCAITMPARRSPPRPLATSGYPLATLRVGSGAFVKQSCEKGSAGNPIPRSHPARRGGWYEQCAPGTEGRACHRSYGSRNAG